MDKVKRCLIRPFMSKIACWLTVGQMPTISHALADWVWIGVLFISRGGFDLLLVIVYIKEFLGQDPISYRF